MTITVTVNRQAIEQVYGGRGGIDRDLGYAIADAILGAHHDGEGTWNVGGCEHTWDYRRGATRATAATSGASVRVDSVRADDSRLWWIDGSTATERERANNGANRCLRNWDKQCRIHGGGIRGGSPLDVGFDPNLHAAL